MAPFKSVSKNKFGYNPTQVDSFIVRARDQYNSVSAQILDWRDITAQKFELSRGGYDISAVDAAIDKLQDTFAERELSKKSNPFAPSLTNSMLLELRGLLLGRSMRPTNKRFGRVGVLGVGYSRKEVDALLSVVNEFLNDGVDLSLQEVRNLSFKVKRGGYFESQVDSYVERLVEYLQTKRFSEPVAASSIVAHESGSFSTDEPTSSEPSGPYSEYE